MSKKFLKFPRSGNRPLAFWKESLPDAFTHFLELAKEYDNLGGIISQGH
jgi:hypothetical protein